MFLCMVNWLWASCVMNPSVRGTEPVAKAPKNILPTHEMHVLQRHEAKWANKGKKLLDLLRVGSNHQPLDCLLCNSRTGPY